MASANVAEGRFLDALVDAITTYPQAHLSSLLQDMRARSLADAAVEPSEEVEVKWQHQAAHHLQTRWKAALSSSSASLSSSATLASLTAETQSFLHQFVDTMELRPAPYRLLNEKSTRDENGKENEEEEGLMKLILQVVTPLLDHLLQAIDSPPSPQTRQLREFYGQLVPVVLQTMAQTGSLPLSMSRSSTLYAWLGEMASNVYLQQLLHPYIEVVVLPLEKELGYHFRAGRETAELHEPQHFFCYLANQFQRLRAATLEGWLVAVPDVLEESSSSAAAISLLTLGQSILASTAAAIFRECYGWWPHTPLLKSQEYVVVVVNALLDCLQQAEGPVCKAALRLLAQHMLHDGVLAMYMKAASGVAITAFENGPAFFWRRSFLDLSASASPPRPLYLGSLHMVRAIEAFLRRLGSTLLLIGPVDVSQHHSASHPVCMLWKWTIEPALSAFLVKTKSEIDHIHGAAPGEEADGHWSSVLALQECVLSLHTVVNAAEDWLNILQDMLNDRQELGEEANDRADGSDEASHSILLYSDALDELTLLRDQMSRRSVELSKHFIKQICAARLGRCVVAQQLLYSLEECLVALNQFPDGSSRYTLLSTMSTAFRAALPPENLAALSAHVEKCRLPQLAKLLSE